MSDLQCINCSYSLKPLYYLDRFFNLHLIPLGNLTYKSPVRFLEALGYFLVFAALFLYVVIQLTIITLEIPAQGVIFYISINLIIVWCTFISYIMFVVLGLVFEKNINKLIQNLESLKFPLNLFKKQRKNNIKQMLISYTICVGLKLMEYRGYIQLNSTSHLIFAIAEILIEIYNMSTILIIGAYGSLFKQLFAEVNIDISNIQHKVFNMDQLTSLCEVHSQLMDLILDIYRLLSVHICFYTFLGFIYLTNIFGFLFIITHAHSNGFYILLWLVIQNYSVYFWKIFYLLWTLHSAKIEVCIYSEILI